MSILSLAIRALRSIQPPEPQKAPMLSLTLETATLGALPPRMAATVLSSLMPPTLFTLIAGLVFWKSAITPLNTFCSRWVNGCQIVTVTGLLGSNFAGAAVVFAPPLSLPPQAPRAAAAQVSTARLARFRRRILSPISLETLPKLARTVRLGRAAVKRTCKGSFLSGTVVVAMLLLEREIRSQGEMLAGA